MSVIDRRDFVKSLSVAVGTAAALGGASPILAEAKLSGDSKSVETKTVYQVFALKYAGPFDRPGAMTFFNQGYKDVIQIHYYIWAIRAGKWRDHAGRYRVGIEPGAEV